MVSHQLTMPQNLMDQTVPVKHGLFPLAILEHIAVFEMNVFSMASNLVASVKVHLLRSTLSDVMPESFHKHHAYIFCHSKRLSSRQYCMLSSFFA